MKPKPYEAQNTKFSEYQRSLLISYATFELLKFESRTDVIIEISRFLRHRRPGINEGVFGTDCFTDIVFDSAERSRKSVVYGIRVSLCMAIYVWHLSYKRHLTAFMGSKC